MIDIVKALIQSLADEISVLRLDTSEEANAIATAVLDLQERVEILEPQGVPLTGDEAFDRIIRSINGLKEENETLRAFVTMQNTRIEELKTTIETHLEDHRINGARAGQSINARDLSAIIEKSERETFSRLRK